jgi:hypothetical protein
MRAPCEDKGDNVKDSLHEDLGRALDQFLRYDMKTLLSDFNAKVGRGEIFKSTIENESSHKISNDNGVRVVNFSTSKNLVVKVPRSLITAIINTPGPILMERHKTTFIMM